MGPLTGLKVIEMLGLGPAPLAGMMLADMGAEVILVERSADRSQMRLPDANRRGKKSIALNLKQVDNVETFLRLVEKADVLIEGYRPGVMERFGLGPEIVLARNPAIVYGRMTGWGQEGPLAHAAGHDINYISLTGALAAIGPEAGKPVPPLNLVGDYGGGGVFLVVGVLAALWEAQASGKGQVVDAAMTDGSAILMTIFQTLHAMGRWNTQRGSNFLDGGAHFYNTYETADGRFVSIGSIEPQFYALLQAKLELDDDTFGQQFNPALWPAQKEKLAAIFKARTRDEWCALFEGSDVCFAPVLDYTEAPEHPHNRARSTYIEVDGILQAAPAPRFSRTPSAVDSGAPYAGEHTDEILQNWLGNG